MEIIKTQNDSELDTCALLMSSLEPFVTLNIHYEKARAGMGGDSKEVYMAMVDGQFTGFVVLMFAGVLRGYLQTLCIDPKYQGQGIGTALIKFAEERFAGEFPNVFLCVSSFNERAQKLYYSLGYEKIGELKDHIITGADEYILRKHYGPNATFIPAV